MVWYFVLIAGHSGYTRPFVVYLQIHSIHCYLFDESRRTRIDCHFSSQCLFFTDAHTSIVSRRLLSSRVVSRHFRRLLASFLISPIKRTIINFQFSRKYYCIIIHDDFCSIVPIKRTTECLEIASKCDIEDWRKWTSLQIKWNLVGKQWRNIANKLYVCFKFVWESAFFNLI